jgi:thioesterase DpgC
MTMQNTFEQAGFDRTRIDQLTGDGPLLSDDWEHDTATSSVFWQNAQSMLDQLPPKPRRSQAETEAAAAILALTRAHRERFLQRHVRALYSRLTRGFKTFLRVDALAYGASSLVPGLTPTRAMVETENQHVQSAKEGHEIDQGIFFGHLMADPDCGFHVCHAMLLPHPETAAYLDRFLKTGRLDLGTASIERHPGSNTIYFQNPRYMHAEDETTVNPVEICVDLCLLDPASSVCVLRGGVIDHGKHQGKRAFCTGINLTHLYHGKVPYLWYLQRELGFINKMYRGIADPNHSPDEVLGQTTEKLWIGAVDQFAIGGGCQYLLVMDINIAAQDAYLTLPARKEGIVPGAANMRMPRFVGDRTTRQAIMMERRIECASPEGRMICDMVVPPDGIDQAIQKTIASITASGVVSAASNRKAFRVAQEPFDMFRRYMSVYAREQAYCHFSPALISNLERNWDASNRKM